MAMTPPEGEQGWWLASDGRWYPPTSVPEPPKPAEPGTQSSYTASDGKEYRIFHPPQGVSGTGPTPPAAPTLPPGPLPASPTAGQAPGAGKWETPTGSTFTVKPVRSNKWRWLMVLGALVVVGVVAGLVIGRGGNDGPAASDDPPVTEPDDGQLIVTFELIDAGDVGGTVDDCYGSGGYNDFRAGMDVKVTDEDGRTIGAGTLLTLGQVAFEDRGLANELRGGRLSTERAAPSCVMAAMVDLDGDAKFYDVEVGRRGTQTYSRADLEGRGWRVDLELS